MGLRAAGVPFVDERVTFAELPALKASGTLPLGQLPVLSVGDATFCQSVPLSRYACRLAGLYPTDALAALAADEVVANIDEMWSKVPGKDEGLRVAYANEVAPKYLAALAKRLGSATFFGGASPNWADLWMYQYVQFFTSGFFDFIPKDFVEKAAPALAKLAAAVKASDLYAKFGTPE